MLQQTQVGVVASRYEAWLQRFPTIPALAAASEEEVLRAWQGLGYYGRARRLHAAAQLIVRSYGSVLPRSAADLRRLPGIGAYTAAAIACIAYGEPKPPLDVNLARVLSRIGGLLLDIPTADRRKKLEYLWHALVEGQSARDVAQALMDLGRLLCRGETPQCGACPVRSSCVAYRDGNVSHFTPRLNRMPKRRLRHVALVVWQRDSAIVRRCRPGEWWQGLWTFPYASIEDDDDPKCVAEELARYAGCRGVHPLATIRHAVTNHAITLHGYAVYIHDHQETLRGDPAALEGWEWVPREHVLRLPMPSPHAKLRTCAGVQLPMAERHGEHSER
jgi:A/G-specific adenine glycosylase